MITKKIYCLLLFVTTCIIHAQAKENIGISGKQAKNYQRLAAGCTDATAQIELDINNVRARLLGAGDFWWDLNNAKYVIPKVYPPDIEVSSSFAGALWVGGIDAGGQLKIAAQTYRQNGNDFWPGPLSDNGTIDDLTCNAYDRHWKVNRSNIDSFNLDFPPDVNASYTIDARYKSILEWPAAGNQYAKGKSADDILIINRDLAPFVDLNFDGQYEPQQGEYPDIDGDQAIFWVYNDKGNIHTESGGDAIGLEIQALAFAFNTNDEINDMTFYKYKVINFSTSPLDSVYFGYWVDSDLGYFSDDWVGCDTTLSLGMCYNGDAVDGPDIASYGANPPIFGTDFFQGPIKYTYNNDGVITDSIRLGMSAFLYYNNDFSVIGNPEVAAHYYGYLSGSWKDGSPFTFGGNGYGGTERTNFIFPSDPSDPTGWSECTENNTPADRRYLQSSGPFRLEPGAKNEVIVGALWTRPPVSGGCQTTFDQIKLADQKAQALFDANFELIDGPDAPDLSIRELDQEIILSITNGPNSNNANEHYSETDPIILSIIKDDPTITDSTYDFQGYKVYQLVNGQVSASEYGDPAKARLILESDLKDSIGNLVNFKFDPLLNADVPTLEVLANNEGIQHTFQVTTDAFATGNTNLVNFKTYYFSVVSYAYNNYRPYDPDNINSQKTPYLEGRNNIKVYTAIPHKSDPENGGMQLNAEYGDGPDIQKIEGIGNGGYFQNFTDQTIVNVLATNADLQPTYRGRMAPVDIKVYDPVRVPAADFELILVDSTLGATGFPVNKDSTWWLITNLTTGEQVKSDFPINFVNEQIIPEWGLSVTVKAVENPGPDESVTTGFVEAEENNGFIGASSTYADPNKQWLTGVPDIDGLLYLDWIRAGIPPDPTSPPPPYPTYDPNPDQNKVYQTILGGTWSPLSLAGQNNNGAGEYYQPMRNLIGLLVLPPAKLASEIGVDVVFTADKSKWSKCVVINTGEGVNTNIYNEDKLDMRQKPSKDADGNEITGEVGRSYFPGYAINIENGQRLNIIFGEDPKLGNDNGDDMLWNPTSNFASPLGLFVDEPIYGGKHYIYVSKTQYDGGQNIHDSLQWLGGVKPSSFIYREIFKNVAWITMPFLNAGSQLLPLSDGLIPTADTVKIRVTKRFEKLFVTGENNGFPKYKFSTAGLAPSFNNTELASSALDLINVVPNPYYAYSAYETNQVDNRIKITNLPAKCTVSIYSMDGTLIRRFKRDLSSTDNTAGAILSSKANNLDTSLDWDLKNEKNIPVASGIYIIHVNAFELGERTLKWFGVMRPIDLNTF